MKKKGLKDEKSAAMTRRTFLKTTGGVAAGLMGASLFDPIGTPFLHAQTKDPIKVAYIDVLSGIFAAQGVAQIKGVRLAEKHINASGGIMGRPVKVFSEDTGAKVQDATRIAKRLILEEGVIAIHGETTTGVSAALSKVAKDHGVIHMDYEMDGTSVYGAMHKLAFRMGNDGPTLVRGLAWLGLNKLQNIKKWGALVPDYAWGHDCLKDLQEALAGKNAEIKPFIHPFGCADFSSYILQIQEYKPDALINFSWSGDFVTFLRQQKPYKLYQKTIGLNFGTPITVCAAMGNDMEPMWTGLDEGHPSLPPGKKFNDMYRKETGEWVFEDTVAQYYDSLFILKKAIEAAKSTKPEEIAKKMEGLEFDGAAGWVKIRATSHLPIKKAYHVGYLAPQQGWPYWGVKDIVSIPYDKVMVTDAEAKDKWKMPLPFTS
jgi:branched-chain amino acid transport system substrate-binding protein